MTVGRSRKSNRTDCETPSRSWTDHMAGAVPGFGWLPTRCRVAYLPAGLPGAKRHPASTHSAVRSKQGRCELSLLSCGSSGLLLCRSPPNRLRSRVRTAQSDQRAAMRRDVGRETRLRHGCSGLRAGDGRPPHSGMARSLPPAALRPRRCRSVQVSGRRSCGTNRHRAPLTRRAVGPGTRLARWSRGGGDQGHDRLLGDDAVNGVDELEGDVGFIQAGGFPSLGGW